MKKKNLPISQYTQQKVKLNKLFLTWGDIQTTVILKTPRRQHRNVFWVPSLYQALYYEVFTQINMSDIDGNLPLTSFTPLDPITPTALAGTCKKFLWSSKMDCRFKRLRSIALISHLWRNFVMIRQGKTYTLRAS